jgi:hypothetical protein
MPFAQGEALFLNGVYEDVLKEIEAIQAELPYFILFLQPYKAEAIKKLEQSPPTSDKPVTVYMSTTTELATVRYTAEVVGWDDKRKLSDARFNVISRIVWCLQPGEGGLYDAASTPGEKSVNLLHIRRLRKVDSPFSVSRLVKTSDGKPYSEHRSTAGGWSYVTVKER